MSGRRVCCCDCGDGCNCGCDCDCDCDYGCGYDDEPIDAPAEAPVVVRAGVVFSGTRRRRGIARRLGRGGFGRLLARWIRRLGSST